MCSSKMILNSGEEERRNDERSEELAKATNELASEEFLRSKNPTRTGKYIYKNAAFKDKKHFTIYCEARNVVPSLVGVLFLISEKVYLYISIVVSTSQLFSGQTPSQALEAFPPPGCVVLL